MSKLSPRQEAARKFVCPNCHAEAGRPCKRPPSFNRASGFGIPGKLMSGLHAERMALAPRTALSTHRSQVPAPAAAYFEERHVDLSAAGNHPVITMEFRDGRWVTPLTRHHVSASWLRKLRAEGTEAVQLTAAGHSPDFTVKELLARPRASRHDDGSAYHARLMPQS